MSHDLEQHLSEALQQGAPWPESLLIDLQSGFEGLQKELDLLRQRLSASLAEPPLVAQPEPAAPSLARRNRPPSRPANWSKRARPSLASMDFGFSLSAKL